MKIFPVGVVVVVNLVLLLATKMAFDAWVREQFGYLDVDMVGFSGLLWIPLVIVATALVAIGFRVSAARWAAAVVTVVLAFIVLDHAIGALRDGVVSLPGAVTGGLMVIQIVALAAGVLLSGGRGTPR